MTDKGLVIRIVADARDRKIFVRLPWQTNRDNPKWAAPLIDDERYRIDARRNPALTYCDMDMALAVRDGRPVGRIMAILNRRHVEKSEQSAPRFGFIEAEDDPEAVVALLAWAESWARDRGCDRIVGPMGFSDQDPEGLLIEGFDEDPGISTLHGPRYMPALIEGAGYETEVDYVTYLMQTEIPDRVVHIAERLAERGGLDLVDFASRAAIKRYAPRIFGLMNQAYEDIYGYVALDDREEAELVRRFLSYLDPRFVKVVEHEGETIGFAIGMPHVMPGFRKANGRLFPFGLFHIWRAMKTTDQINMLLGGVKPSWRGHGVEVLLGIAVITAARDAGYTRLDSQHVLATNAPMRKTYENWGGHVYKRHRIYRKALR